MPHNCLASMAPSIPAARRAGQVPDLPDAHGDWTGALSDQTAPSGRSEFAQSRKPGANSGDRRRPSVAAAAPDDFAPGRHVLAHDAARAAPVAVTRAVVVAVTPPGPVMPPMRAMPVTMANPMVAVAVTMPMPVTVAMAARAGDSRVGHDDGPACGGDRQPGRQQRCADGFAGCDGADYVPQHGGSPLPDGLSGSGFAPLHAHGSQQRTEWFTAWMIF